MQMVAGNTNLVNLERNVVALTLLSEGGPMCLPTDLSLRPLLGPEKRITTRNTIVPAPLGIGPNTG